MTGGLRPTDDVARGRWVIDELGTWATIAGIVPPRFAAYARIFHRTGGHTLYYEDGVPAWSDAGRLRWADIASREGTVMHPLAQWQSLLGDHVQPTGDRAGFQYDQPDTGLLDLDSLAAVARVLAGHTATPHDTLAALWEGHGEIWGGVVQFTIASESESESATAAPPVSETLPPLFPGAAEAARLALPHRDSLLFELDVRTLAEPGWAQRSGWTSGSRTLTPQCLWPEDRSWFLASEIDYDSTLVGGSEGLIAELLDLGRSGAIEVLRVPGDADLTDSGDRVNPRRS